MASKVAAMEARIALLVTAKAAAFIAEADAALQLQDMGLFSTVIITHFTSHLT